MSRGDAGAGDGSDPRQDRQRDLERIAEAMERAGDLLLSYAQRDLQVDHKAPGHPVTEADRAADDLLKEMLPRNDDGWLSEETVDDPERLERRRVWVVDPLDGTKEFIAGIPEWSVSVALVEDGRPVAGGIYNPVAGDRMLGAVGLGVTYNGAPTRITGHGALEGARVVASRSEVRRGEWDRWRQAGCEVVPTGSVAYKLALVAAGHADATWTLTPKSEWDVAAGAALILAAGGEVCWPDGRDPGFNRPDPTLPGFLGASPSLIRQLTDLLRNETPR